MRECIYCGRILEKGEKCSCAMSVARRMEKEKNQEPDQKSKQKQKQEKKQACKKETRDNSYKKQYTGRKMNFNAGGVFRDFINHFISFIKSPIETVMNPGPMSKGLIIMFAAFEGIILGLCTYSIMTNTLRGAFRFLGNLMGFGGMNGYSAIKGWLLSAVSGGVSGIVVFFIYSGIFYIVNRWIFKQFTPYWEFVKRFAFAALPVSLIGLIGVVLGLFSQVTFTALLLCGLIGTLIITYEILRSVWYSKSPSITIYTMMACIFVFIMVMMTFLQYV